MRKRVTADEALLLRDNGAKVTVDWMLSGSTLPNIPFTERFTDSYPDWRHMSMNHFVEVEDDVS